MKKLLPIVFIFLGLFAFSLFTPSSALAQNICGVNIAGLYHQVGQVANLVGPGGWVVTMGNTCACSTFEGIFGHGLNVVIRADNGGRGFTEEEAIAWVATLGDMDSKGQMIYFMPWNEPNHSHEGGGPTAGNYVYQYSQFLKSHLEASGLLGTKVTLLSPMVDKLNPSFEGFFTNPGGKAGFYSLFNGSSINEYDLFAPGPCTASPTANNCMYDQIGIPAPFYALETGVAGTCNPPCYNDNDIRRMLDVSWGKWSSDPNFEMFAILSYDPHRHGEFNIFTVPQTMNFYQNHCSPGGVTPGSFNAGQFNQWLAEHEDELLPCDGCGYSPESLPPPPPVGPPDLPPDYFPAGSLQCRPELTGDRDSRPYRNLECDLCNITGQFCLSCATSFTVFDTVSWEWRDKDNECEGNVWVTRDWPEPPPGTIEINPSDTKIPFVGKKGKEDEQKYLADYFEGTNEYYENYSHYWKDWINYAGVWRKLSPMGYQNILKKQMVERALATTDIQEKGVHDYQLNYIGRLCWDAPFWLEALIAVARRLRLPVDKVPDITNYCLFSDKKLNPLDDALIAAIKLILDASPIKISHRYTVGVKDKLTSLDGHFPPEPDEEDYLDKWDAWKESGEGEWYRLWTVVPVFSHEDTPGQILPYLGSKPLDTFEITNPKAQVEKVPHVARLYESTQEIQKMLVPFYKEDLLFSQNKSEPIIASAEKNVLGEKILIAQAGSLSTGFSISLSSKGGNQYDLCWAVSGHASGGCNYCDWGYCIQPYGFCEPMLPKHCWAGNPTLTCNMGSAHPISITANPGDTVCATLNISSGVCSGPCCDPDPRPGFSKTACCQILEDGTSTCGTGPVEPPHCGLPKALPVNQCEMEAITDTNENDDLCCESINIEMTAVDMFINENYTECSDYTCGPTGTSLCPDDPCLNKETREVNREIGITLLHPYLTNIWEQTGIANTAGLFNIFRPAKIAEFGEIDASSEIMYSQSGFDSIAPSIGKFYFNYLGGVQLAKEWVIKALMPLKSDIEIPQ